jgi:hypothetical protein
LIEKNNIFLKPQVGNGSIVTCMAALNGYDQDLPYSGPGGGGSSRRSFRGFKKGFQRQESVVFFFGRGIARRRQSK